MPKRIIKAIKHVRTKANQKSIIDFLSINKNVILKSVIVSAILLSSYGIYCIFDNSQAKKYSAILHESLLAQQTGDIKTAKEKLLQIHQSKFVPANVSAIASLRYAGFLIEEGNKKEAGEIYFAVNNCFSCNDYLSDLAGLLAVSTWLSDDELMKTDLSEKVNKIYKKSRELKSYIAEQRGFYEMQKNNLAVANKVFAEIIDDANADKAIKARAQDAKKMLIQKGFKEEVSESKSKKESLKKDGELKTDDSKKSTENASQEPKDLEKKSSKNK
jgi:hypothetical protein